MSEGLMDGATAGQPSRSPSTDPPRRPAGDPFCQCSLPPSATDIVIEHGDEGVAMIEELTT
jgi:hypothetical protein